MGIIWKNVDKWEKTGDNGEKNGDNKKKWEYFGKLQIIEKKVGPI